MKAKKTRGSKVASKGGVPIGDIAIALFWENKGGEYAESLFGREATAPEMHVFYNRAPLAEREEAVRRAGRLLEVLCRLDLDIIVDPQTRLPPKR